MLVSVASNRIADNCSKSARIAATMPILVIQEMNEQFLLAKHEKRHLKYQGGLHPLHSDFIQRVHLIHPSRRQVYAVKHLNAHPHFGILPHDLGLFL